MDDFLKFLEKYAVKIGGKLNKDFVVGKTVPMTKEQIKEWKDYDKFVNEAQVMADKSRSMSKLFWSKIELGLGVYDSMRVNEKTMEIEIEAVEDGKNSIKSPFFQR